MDEWMSHAGEDAREGRVYFLMVFLPLRVSALHYVCFTTRHIQVFLQFLFSLFFEFKNKYKIIDLKIKFSIKNPTMLVIFFA